ncbi:hypothetical protein [Streptomyces sp. RFCAC02]|uniref:hypothetical protein n=1 Tax=Streptomyces sp. RFCAC02 TaxID=2499143 RepID=UPI001021773D|nr:hypothetical protein [Streptomyces sp. RFCAC02]
MDADDALHIVEARPGIHHTVLTEGGPVYGAGEVVFPGGRDVVSLINNGTGHYTPQPSFSEAFLNEGVTAFEAQDIRVPLRAITDLGGIG